MERPILSVTIPTFNRGSFLGELLEGLLPQLQSAPAGEVELVISDNSSEDNTKEVVTGLQARGLPCRYIRNETNIGSDSNFLQCFHEARGEYVWVLGDDDLVVPGAIPDLLSLLRQGTYDMVYLSSFGFSNGVQLGRTEDGLGRYAEIVTDGEYFLEKVNALIGLISVVIVNKQRLMAIPHPPIEELRDTNLLQTGWLFPLIRPRMRVLYIWRRLVGYRLYNSGGWGVCEVFGVRLERVARKYFAESPQLIHALLNGVLRYWMFDVIMQHRRGQQAKMNDEDFAKSLRSLYRHNWRYWLFVYPAAKFPMPVMRPLYRVLAFVNHLTRIGQGIFRHVFRHGRYLQP